MPWALFHDGRQVSKAHSTRIAAMIEAMEARAVIRSEHSYELADGYEVRPVCNEAREG